MATKPPVRVPAYIQTIYTQEEDTRLAHFALLRPQQCNSKSSRPPATAFATKLESRQPMRYTESGQLWRAIHEGRDLATLMLLNELPALPRPPERWRKQETRQLLRHLECLQVFYANSCHSLHNMNLRAFSC